MGRFRFGRRSLEALHTCHPLLQEILKEAILRSEMDFSVLEGYRNQEDQDRAVRNGFSKVSYPDSMHNKTDLDGTPRSLAVDVAPYPIDWSNTIEFRWLAGFIMGIGCRYLEPKGYRLRWGGSWKSDGNHSTKGFVDLPHLELRKI